MILINLRITSLRNDMLPVPQRDADADSKWNHLGNGTPSWHTGRSPRP